MQKNGAGLTTASACWWDTSNDGTVTVIWPKEKQKENQNKTLNCLVSVFAVSF